MYDWSLLVVQQMVIFESLVEHLFLMFQVQIDFSKQNKKMLRRRLHFKNKFFEQIESFLLVQCCIV